MPTFLNYFQIGLATGNLSLKVDGNFPMGAKLQYNLRRWALAMRGSGRIELCLL